MSEPDLVPDIDNFRLFAWWCASKSEGRLAEKADIKTLSFNVGRFARFYNGCHAFKISDKDLKDVREVRILHLQSSTQAYFCSILGRSWQRNSDFKI